VAIGAFTNLARLEQERPGSLRAARIIAMAGWLDAPPADLPQWGPEMDFNVQCDSRAAGIVAAAAGDLTLVTLPAAMLATLRARDLPRLRAAGAVGALLAGSRRCTRKTAIWKRSRAGSSRPAGRPRELPLGPRDRRGRRGLGRARGASDACWHTPSRMELRGSSTITRVDR
jgi:inosine-uridine nucleoside N-ribohydrolase